MLIYSICEETQLLVCEIYPNLLVREDGMVKNINQSVFNRCSKPWHKGSYSPNYLSVGIPNTKYKKQVHVLVAEAFIPNPLNNTVVDHIDGDITNNCLKNLRWVTTRENMQNQVVHRTSEKLFGCTWEKSRSKWKAQVHVGKSNIFIGRYATEIEAHEAYMNYIKDNHL